MKKQAMAHSRPVHVLLILSILASFFILPQPAKAGILSSVLCKIRPLTKIAGKIGGAVIGASLCSAFVPPLGIIAGGIAGWVVGGIVTSYGTRSLRNLATLGGAAAGAMAFGPGALGAVGGFLLGGFIGRTVMKILQKGDRKLTGGILLNKGHGSHSAAALSPAGFSGPAKAPRVSAASEVTVSNVAPQPQQIRELEQNYRAAYKNYISATQGGDASKIKGCHKAYLKAFSEYKKVMGVSPK